MKVTLKMQTSLSSYELAGLIVDALLQAKLVASTGVKRAIQMAMEEINARKSGGDYWCNSCTGSLRNG